MKTSAIASAVLLAATVASGTTTADITGSWSHRDDDPASYITGTDSAGWPMLVMVLFTPDRSCQPTFTIGAGGIPPGYSQPIEGTTIRLRVDTGELFTGGVTNFVDEGYIYIRWQDDGEIHSLFRKGRTARIKMEFANGNSEYVSIPLAGYTRATNTAVAQCKRTMNRATEVEWYL